MASNGLDEDWELISKPSPTEDRGPGCIHRRWGAFEFHLHVRHGRNIHQQIATSNLNKQKGSSDTVFATTPHEAGLQSQSPLFAIPAEIRLKVYEDLLTVSDDVQAGCKHTSVRPSILSILQTCRRILFEAEEIYYNVNRLEHRVGSHYPGCLNTRRREAVTALAVRNDRSIDGGTAHLAVQKLVGVVPNLQSLWIFAGMSIRFLDIPSWKIMEPQIRGELLNFKRLSDLKIVLPEVKGELSADEISRKEKFEGVVRRLQENVVGSG